MQADQPIWEQSLEQGTAYDNLHKQSEEPAQPDPGQRIQGAMVTARVRNQRREAMGQKGETYICEICGQVVEVKKGGAGELVCCGEPMKKE